MDSDFYPSDIRYRSASCWSCHAAINSNNSDVCPNCGWLVCYRCGACRQSGCSSTKSFSVQDTSTYEPQSAFSFSSIFSAVMVLFWGTIIFIFAYGILKFWLSELFHRLFPSPSVHYPVYSSQVLWYRNKRTGVVESVSVRDTFTDGFTVLYNGKEHKMSYGDIGVRLYKSEIEVDAFPKQLH